MVPSRVPSGVLELSAFLRGRHTNESSRQNCGEVWDRVQTRFLGILIMVRAPFQHSLIRSHLRWIVGSGFVREWLGLSGSGEPAWVMQVPGRARKVPISAAESKYPFLSTSRRGELVHVFLIHAVTLKMRPR